MKIWERQQLHVGLILGLFFCCSVTSPCQVLINEAIGYAIDKEEKEKYHLLTFISTEEFDSAMFYPGSEWDIQMIAWLSSGEKMERLFSEEQFEQIRKVSSASQGYLSRKQEQGASKPPKEEFYTGLVLLCGVGYPEGLQADIRYPLKPFQLGIGIGNMPYDLAEGYSFHFELVFHFAGQSKFSYLQPWYTRFAIYFNQGEHSEEDFEPNFYLLNFGREFNISKRWGWSIDAGMNVYSFVFFGASGKVFLRTF